jgi:mono/diheme cytochrome c family protein
VAAGVISAPAGISAPQAAGDGDPARGGLVWTSNACGSCHAFSRAGSSGARGANAPNLDRYLVPDARRAKLSTGLFTFARVYWGGRGMSAYGTALSTQELEDLVSFVIATPFSAPSERVAPVPPLPPPPPLVTASSATVARWAKLARLPSRAAQGAALFAKLGCLSCHTYLGSGMRRRGAPDLSKAGLEGRSSRFFVDYVARPYRRGNNLMPTYADVSSGALARIAAFLVASRGPRPR